MTHACVTTRQSNSKDGVLVPLNLERVGIVNVDMIVIRYLIIASVELLLETSSRKFQVQISRSKLGQFLNQIHHFLKGLHLTYMISSHIFMIYTLAKIKNVKHPDCDRHLTLPKKGTDPLDCDRALDKVNHQIEIFDKTVSHDEPSDRLKLLINLD